MKILITAATTYEISPFLEYCEQKFERRNFFQYACNGHLIYPFVTGPGMVNMAFGLARLEDIKTYDIAINAGIGAGMSLDIVPGQIFDITKDRFADMGVATADHQFTDLFDMELLNPNTFPYDNGWIDNSHHILSHLIPLKGTGLSVNSVPGEGMAVISSLKKYDPDILSMEGAAFLYACKMMDLNCIQLRSVSHILNDKKQAQKNLSLAIDRLNACLVDTIDKVLPVS